MDKNSLRDLVARLHGELTEALREDPKSRERLRDLMKDINRLIDKPTVMPSSPHGSLPTGWKESRSNSRPITRLWRRARGGWSTCSARSASSVLSGH